MKRLFALMLFFPLFSCDPKPAPDTTPIEKEEPKEAVKEDPEKEDPTPKDGSHFTGVWTMEGEGLKLSIADDDAAVLETKGEDGGEDTTETGTCKSDDEKRITCVFGERTTVYTFQPQIGANVLLDENGEMAFVKEKLRP